MRSLLTAAAELQTFLFEQKWRFCFIGGIALQRWGAARLTLDIDVSLLAGLGQETHYANVLCGRYKSRIPDASSFAAQNRVVLLQTTDQIPLDIALAAFPYEELVVDRATPFDFIDGVSLRTCSAEDLIILKVFADRTRDWADVESIITNCGPQLDQAYIIQHLEALCELNDKPENVAKLTRLLPDMRRAPGSGP